MMSATLRALVYGQLYRQTTPRNGYAKQTLQAIARLPYGHLPQITTDIFLTVNCKNEKRQNLYVINGFQDTSAHIPRVPFRSAAT